MSVKRDQFDDFFILLYSTIAYDISTAAEILVGKITDDEAQWLIPFHQMYSLSL